MKIGNKKVVSFLLALALVAFTQCAQAETIKYVGSSTVGKFIHEAVKIYDGAKFNISTKPESGGGEIATAKGKCDIGGVARDVKPAIIKQGVQKVLIGKDAIGVWVNADNSISDLSPDQLKAIFTGKITNWKEVGGVDLGINVYIVNKQSATRKVFQKIILGTDAYAGKAIKTIRPDSAILDNVGNDPAGIGQLSFAFASGHLAVDKVKKLNIGGQEALLIIHHIQLPVLFIL